MILEDFIKYHNRRKNEKTKNSNVSPLKSPFKSQTKLTPLKIIAEFNQVPDDISRHLIVSNSS